MDKESEVENWQTGTTEEYHRKQYFEPKRSTVAFYDFLDRAGCLSGAKHILDLGCGGGSNDVYIASRHRELRIDGIDIVDKFFYMLNNFASEDIKGRVSLKQGDFYDLDAQMRDKYDGIISMQTLSWLEGYEKPLEQMCSLNPKWIGISSLFYEGRIDYQIKLKDYEEQGLTQPYTEKYYNIYPLPIVRDFLAERGYTHFIYEPFEIDIDIPKPDHLNIGTYTVKAEDGSRLQISGALMLPWYFVYASK